MDGLEKKIDYAVEIFNAVYEGNIEREQMLYKHFLNPFKVKEPIQFYEENGVISGMNAFMGTYFKEKGNMHFLLQSCDTAVLPEFRGKGIFTKLINEREKNDSEAEFIFGLPNENSFPGFIKMGWKEIAKFTVFIKIINPGSFLLGNERKIGRMLDKIWSFIFSKIRLKEDEYCQVNENVVLNDEEIQCINEEIENGFLRNNEFYRWKTNQPSKKFKVIRLKSQESLSGLVIYHTKRLRGRKCVVIDDWFAKGNKEDKKRKLRNMINFIRQDGSLMEIPFVNVSSDDFWIWKKLKFVQIPFYKRSSLVVSPRGKENEFLGTCSFKNIDTDTILN